ncbi:MAG TPA: PEGA domain-containing protein, partial [Kofleriaceae bacterium]|nr:PEGA domain-containing protein [Kofleriaceae bacterium]
TSLRSHLDVRPRVSNDTDGVTVVSAAREAAAAGAPARATALDPPAPAPDHAPVSVPAPGPRSAKLGPASSPPPKAAAPVSAPLRRRTAIIGWAVFALLAAGAIAGGAYVLQGSGGSPAQANAPAGADRPDLVATPPPGSTPPSTAPPPPIDAALPPPPDAAPSRPPDAAPSSTQVNLRIKTTPSDATVLLDGKRLGRTPYTGTVEAAPGTHVLKIRKRGYIAVILDVELSGDVTREVALQRTKSEPAPP